jgi:hypothetical protein
MRRFLFSGIVHPERLGLTLGTIDQMLASQDGTKLGDMKFSIQNSQITAVMEWENDSEDIFTLRNILKTFVEPILNITGFLKGYAFDIEITKVFESDLNEIRVFNNDIPALAERNKTRELTEAKNIYPLCSGPEGIYLRRCLGDLNMAMKHADDTPFYCYRALESLKQYFGFVNGITGDREQWKSMASALGGREEDVTPIKDLAFPARHGIPNPITDPKRKDIFLLTWNIVERFIDYRLKQCGSNYRLQP